MNSPVNTTLALLDRARNGDADALNELIDRYLPRLTRWASGRLPPAARHMLDTADIVQDAMLKTVRNLGGMVVENDGALQAYLRQALVNRLADAYRGSRRQANDTVLLSDVESPEASPLEAAIGSEAAQRYERGLAKLKESDRTAVILRVELCYGYDQIAEMLGKSSAASARVAVSRALARLAEEMRNA